jgi:hypothetical protein
LQELLLNVYEEYKKYCERHRRDVNQVTGGGLLQVKKSEIVTGRRPQVQPLPNTFVPQQQYQTGQGQFNNQTFNNQFQFYQQETFAPKQSNSNAFNSSNQFMK